MSDKLIILSEEAFDQINQKLDALLGRDSKQRASQEWLTNGDVLTMLDISRSTLQSYRDRMVIPFYQVGRKIFYKPADIEAYMAKYKIVSPLNVGKNGR